jgi:hypothetical protein
MVRQQLLQLPVPTCWELGMHHIAGVGCIDSTAAAIADEHAAVHPP